MPYNGLVFQNPYLVISAALAIFAAVLVVGALFSIAQRDARLNRSEARLKAIIDSAIDGIISIDEQGMIQSVNPSAERLFGYQMSEMIGQNLALLMPEPYHGQHQTYIDTYLHTGQASVIGRERQFIAQRKDGTMFPVMLSVAEVKIKNQRLFTGIVRDITAEIQAQEAEHEQRRLAEALRDSASALNSTLELDEVMERVLAHVGRVVPHDAATVMLIEGGDARLVGSRGFPPQAQERLSGLSLKVADHRHLREMAESAQPLLIPHSRRQPYTLDIKALPQAQSYLGAPILIDGSVRGFINLHSTQDGFFTDQQVAHLKAFASQAALAIQNARLYRELETYSDLLVSAIEQRTVELQRIRDRIASILDNSPDPILLLDTSGCIRTANFAFQDLFGYSIDEVFDKKPDILVSANGGQILEPLLESALKEGRKGRLEVVGHHKNGMVFDIDLAISPIRGEAGVTGIVCGLRDIRKLKQVERMKDAFVSNVSHELRTPITSLKLFLGLLKTAPDQERAELLTVLTRETHRLHQIVEDVLRLSRLDQGQIELTLGTVDLNQLVAEIVGDQSRVAQDHELALVTDLAPKLPDISADRGLVSQVIHDLLGNALKYTPSGGKIVVATRSQRFDSQHWVGCTISDTGPGIPLEEQEHLFERFYRGKIARESSVPGTGLGLTIAKEIIDRHDGRIKVKSHGVPGEGSSFSVWLPIARRSKR